MVNPHEICRTLATELNIKVVSFKIGEADGEPLFLSWSAAKGFFFTVGEVEHPSSPLAAEFASNHLGELLRGCR